MSDRQGTALAPESSRLHSAPARQALAGFVGRVRVGDIGSLPIVVGLVIIAIIFQTLNSAFLSPRNLVNLVTDAVPVGVIAVGVVLVLLVAEIDLSVGSMSGVASSILGVALTRGGWPLWLAMVVALAAGVIVGIVYTAIFVRFHVPSFVITLAGLLSLLGFQLYVLGSGGSINISFESGIVQFMQRAFVPAVLSYVLAALCAIGYLLSRIVRLRRRRAHHLASGSLAGVVVKSAVLLVALEVVCWYLNRAAGVSLAIALLVVMVIVVDFALSRTRWGRAVYAVGGSVEAARRAGLNLTRVYLSVFVLCALLAALGGLLSAGRLAASSISSGTGNVNLDAIAAAVIGGTSLFGGRGSAFSALLGIIVIQSIVNGLTLLNLTSAAQFMITGAVLMIAVMVDSLTRRTRAAHGAE